jgi:hypothetical protein
MAGGKIGFHGQEGHVKILKYRPESAAPSVWEILGSNGQKGVARVLTLSELSEAARTNRHRRTRGSSDTFAIAASQPSASRLLAPLPIADDEDAGKMDDLVRRIGNSLSPYPSDEEITEAARVAFWALTDEERQSLTVDELRRRLSVYRSIEDR